MRIKIPVKLRDEPNAVRMVERYFAVDPRTGRVRDSAAYFERLGGGGDRPETAHQITAEDLLAVSMLGVPVVSYYALHVLDYRGREISGLLAQIPLDVELWQLLHDIKPRPLGQEPARQSRSRQAAGAQAPAPDSRLRQLCRNGSQPDSHPRDMVT